MEWAFESIARLARWAADLGAHEEKLAGACEAWDKGQAARDQAQADAQAAEARLGEIEMREKQGEAAARTAMSKIQSAVAAAVEGRLDDPVTDRHLAPAALRTLQAHAPGGRPTLGFWFRFGASRNLRTGALGPLSKDTHGAIGWTFDAIDRLAHRAADLGANEATLRSEREAWEAGRAARDQAQAHAQAASRAATETREEAEKERARLLDNARREADAIRPDPLAVEAEAEILAAGLAEERLREAELVSRVTSDGLVRTLRVTGVDPRVCDALDWSYTGGASSYERFRSRGRPSAAIAAVARATADALDEAQGAKGSLRRRFERFADIAIRLGEATRAALAAPPDEEVEPGLLVLKALGRARRHKDERDYPHSPASTIERHPAYRAFREEAEAALRHAQRVHLLTRLGPRPDDPRPRP